jgi:signal transduction histidine kinase
VGLLLFVLAVEMNVSFDLRLTGVFVAILSLIGFVLLRLHLVLRENVALYEGAEVARTEAERQREVAEKAMSAAEEASRAKSQFLSNMSHELRTPLNAIMLPDLHKIQAASKHLLSLINDILDLSKIEAGKMELYLSRFDLNTVIEEVSTTVYPLVQKNSNRLEVQTPPDLGMMYADETKVRQILYNLVSNACKFTKEGTILLDVAVDSSNGSSWIVWRVQDSGIGMTADQLSRLFQAFTQADSSTSRKYGGTGLGLVISQRFSQMMGGSIAVESAAGIGTTFTVKLPRDVQPVPESSLNAVVLT